VCECVFPGRPGQWYRTLGMVIATPGEGTATTASNRSLSAVKACTPSAADKPVVAMPARAALVACLWAGHQTRHAVYAVFQEGDTFAGRSVSHSVVFKLRLAVKCCL